MPIIKELKSIKSRRKELKKFGIILGVFLGLLGLFLLWRGKSAIYILILSGVFFLFGLFLPFLLKPIYKIWMAIAFMLGWVVTRLILTISYYFLITPIGLLGRLFGKKFLDLQFKKDVKSYWIPREEKKIKKDSYERQF